MSPVKDEYASHRNVTKLEYELKGEPIGGKTDEGEVRVATYLGLKRAFKKIRRNSLSDPESVDNEVRVLSLLRHTHLIRIIDYGWFQVSKHPPTAPSAPDRMANPPEEDWFAIVTDYIEGSTLSQRLRKGGVSIHELIHIFDDGLEALAYLHEHGVLHMDVKPSNIMVGSSSGGPTQATEATVIDLGFSIVANLKRFSEFFPNEADVRTPLRGDSRRARTPRASAGGPQPLRYSDHVRVNATVEYTRPRFRPFLRRLVRRDAVLKRLFPDHDLYGFGLVIEECLKSVTADADERENYEGLEILSQRLKAGHYSRFGIRGAGTALADLRKLNPETLSPMDVPELSLVPSPLSYIQLSHQPATTTKRMGPLLDHPLVQRLRLIPQLDFIYLFYPDARHSRLGHSLLTYELSRYAIANLIRFPSFRLQVSQSDVEATLIYALLHDIGHLPLIHMFEDFKRLGMKSDDDLLMGLLHTKPARANGEGHSAPASPTIPEDISRLCRAVSIAWFESAKRLAKGSGNSKSLIELIEEEFSPETARALVEIVGVSTMGWVPSNPAYVALAAIVSSPIDVDKAAYLILDSSMTGVSYGRGIDFTGYLTALRPPTLGSQARSGPKIGIYDYGLSAVESLLLARSWMINRVYWERNNRRIIAAFKFVVFKLFFSGESSYSLSEYARESIWLSEIEAAKLLAREFDKQFASESIWNPIADLVAGDRPRYTSILTIGRAGERSLYRRLVGIRVDPWKLGRELCEVILDSIKGQVGSEFRATYCVHSGTTARLKEGLVIVDIPLMGRDRLPLNNVEVLSEVETRSGVTQVRNLYSASRILRQLGPTFQDESKKIRIFVDKEVMGAIPKGRSLTQLRFRLLERIRSSVGRTVRPGHRATKKRSGVNRSSTRSDRARRLK